MAEIQAGIVAIRQAVAARRSKLVIHTDSQFLISCVTQWMQGWKVRTKVREREGWKLRYRGKCPRGEYFYLSKDAHPCLIFLCAEIRIMVYCAKILVRYRYMLHGHHNLLFGFDQCLWNASLSHGI